MSRSLLITPRRGGRARAVVMLIALCFAALVPVVVASPAQAANPSGCRTIVREFSKSGTTLTLRYEVWCSVTQARIITTARILNQTTGIYSANANKDCRDTYYCQVKATMTDKAGTQHYVGEGVDCLPGYPSCVILAIARNGVRTESTEMLPCTAPCLGGMTLKHADF